MCFFGTILLHLFICLDSCQRVSYDTYSVQHSGNILPLRICSHDWKNKHYNNSSFAIWRTNLAIGVYIYIYIPRAVYIVYTMSSRSCVGVHTSTVTPVHQRSFLLLCQTNIIAGYSTAHETIVGPENERAPHRIILRLPILYTRPNLTRTLLQPRNVLTRRLDQPTDEDMLGQDMDDPLLLPEGWMVHTSKSGEVFYHHFDTGDK